MELLVHATAPSSRKDDQKYQRQAENYGTFEIATSSRLADGHIYHAGNSVNISQVRENQANNESETKGSSGLHGSFEVPASSPPFYVDDTQLAISALESQLLTSSLKLTPLRVSQYTASSVSVGDASNEVVPLHYYDPAASPTNAPYLNAKGSGEQTGCSSSSNRIPDSSYVPILQGHDLAIGFVGNSDKSTIQEVNHSSQATGLGSAKRTHSSSWTGDEVSSQLPSSYSLSDGTSKGSRQAIEVPRSSPPLPSTPQGRLPAAGVSQSLVQMRTSSHEASAVIPGQGLATVEPPATEPETPATMPIPTVAAVVQQQPTPSKALSETLSHLTWSIEPPAPPTRSNTFRTHVTSSLKTLLANPVLIGRYKPQHTTRVPRTSERGHWRVDTTLMDRNVQIEFWCFLQRMVEPGNAGWGIWCIRESDKQDTDGSGGVAQGIGVVRVFCWGEVVEHVYLLLYVASKSKVRKLGATWIDADELVVIQM